MYRIESLGIEEPMVIFLEGILDDLILNRSQGQTHGSVRSLHADNEDSYSLLVRHSFTGIESAMTLFMQEFKPSSTSSFIYPKPRSAIIPTMLLSRMDDTWKPSFHQLSTFESSSSLCVFVKENPNLARGKWHRCSAHAEELFLC